MARLFLMGAMVLGLVAPAWSADPPAGQPDMAAMMKAFEEAAKPSPELKKLQPLDGKWEYTCKMWFDPSAPAMESKGTMEREWILGGRFLDEKVSGEGFGGGKFEGRGVIGYDKQKQKFTAGWICDMCTSMSTSLGTYDEGTKTFTFHREDYCPLRKKMVKGRDEIKVESNDKNVMTSYELEDDKEKKVMEIVSTRKQ